MAQTLEPLRLAALTNMEAGQLIKRHLADFGTIDPALLTNAPFNKYVQALTSQSALYEKALAQIQKNEETDKIASADGERDTATEAFSRALKLYAVSDVAEEVEASRSLSILFGTFKNLAKLNYEAESIAIDKLVSELTSPAYSAKVSLLQIDRYVQRMKTTNDKFKALFGNRMVVEASAETYNMKVVRKETLDKYSEFAAYILAMATAVNTPLFETSLNLLNTARKYYSDMVARRATPKTKKKDTPTQ